MSLHQTLPRHSRPAALTGSSGAVRKGRKPSSPRARSRGFCKTGVLGEIRLSDFSEAWVALAEFF